MKRLKRNINDYSWSAINSFLLNPSSEQYYIDLILNFEGLDDSYEIEDRDFLGCVNDKVDKGFNKVITVGTSKARIYRKINRVNNHNFFEFDRLFIKFAVKDDVELYSNNYYSKDELNYLIKKKLIYPLNYSYKNLNYIPKEYVEDYDEKLVAPYVCKFDYLKNSYNGFGINKDYIIYDYYINKLKEEYPIERVLSILKEFIKIEFYRDYVNSKYNNDIKTYYLGKQDQLNKLCNKYEVRELNLITIDKLEDYFISQVDVCKEERFNDIGYDYIVYLLCNSCCLYSGMLEKIKNAIILLNDSKLCYVLLVNNNKIMNYSEYLDVIINNNDVESCYSILMDYNINFEKEDLLRIYDIVITYGKDEEIDNIKKVLKR